MSDTCTAEKRSEIMSLVHSKNTGPELAVRRLIFGMGYRYRLHVKELPSKPDVVLIGRRKIVDIRGCFWHGHRDCKYARLPKSREDYWRVKIDRNRQRDSENLRRLEGDGWKVFVVWECELRNLELLKNRLHEFIEAK